MLDNGNSDSTHGAVKKEAVGAGVLPITAVTCLRTDARCCARVAAMADCAISGCLGGLGGVSAQTATEDTLDANAQHNTRIRFIPQFKHRTKSKDSEYHPRL